MRIFSITTYNLILKLADRLIAIKRDLSDVLFELILKI